MSDLTALLAIELSDEAAKLPEGALLFRGLGWAMALSVVPWALIGWFALS